MAAQLLSGVLAGMVGLGSVALYLAAFFFPEVHRRHDFFWSGVGCFYALILWLDASQITPTELVGHLASISLMGWLGWQTLTLRRKRTPMAQQTPYTADSWPTFRREMTALVLDALRQTPLGRWLPDSTVEPAQGPGIRVSALKDVGYEFVDSVEPPDVPALPRRFDAAATETQPPRVPTRTTPVRASQPLAPPSPMPQPTTQPPITQPPVPVTQPPALEKRPRVPLSSPSRGKGMSWGQRVQGLVTWGQEVVRSKTTPKPKKSVIEIPPRPSSLANRAPSTVPAPPASTGKPRAVQPPPGSSSAEASSEYPTPDVLGAISIESPQPPDPEAVAEAVAEAMPEASAQATSGASPSVRPSQDEPEASNWDDDGDEDWI